MTALQITLAWAAGFGMAVAMLTVYVAWCREHDFHPVSVALGKFRKLPWYGQVIVLCCVGGLVSYGGGKTNAPPNGATGGTNAPPEVVSGGETNAPPDLVTGVETNEPWAGEGEMPTNPPPPLLMMASPRMTAGGQQQGLSAGAAPDCTDSGSTGFTAAQIGAGAAIVGVGTNETHDFSMPAGAHVVECWRRRGAASERVALDGAGETPPPLIDGERIEVDTFGRIRTARRVFSPLGIQVGMVPMANWARIGAASLCWWTVTASNSAVVCWQNALLNRDTNTPVSVQAEFQDNGKFEYRYNLSSIGAAATNVSARIVSTNGVESVALGAGVTTVRGHLLGPEDGTVLDKDNDGLSTYDEIFLYGTDPELPDTDGDGRSDGDEVWSNGSDPLVGDVPGTNIIARIAAGETNEAVGIVSGELRSTKLWDGFVFWEDPGTNALYTRTFEIDRHGGWTSYFISGRGEDWCGGGEGTIQDWSLIGVQLEWEDDTGASGVVTASPRNDTLYLPLGTNATAVTVALRPTVGGGRHASPSPMYLLEYSPRMEFPGGQGFEGDDGNSYSVFTDPEDCSFSLDTSNRPCRAQAGEGEATAADFRMPSGPGVYRLPLVETAEPDVHPLLMMAPLLGAPPNDNGGDRYLVILDPWVSYGYAHYGCWHSYPYDWGWYGYWCDCTPDCGCGVAGYAAVNAYIDWYDGWECEGVVEIAGREVWRDTAYHIVWACDHHQDEEEHYCPCGCDENCQYCSCMKSDGPSQGSIRFRVGLGTDYQDQKIGFAWFESDGPVQIRPQIFEVDSRPDVYVREQDIGGTKYITTYETHGRDLVISALSNGVSVALKHHGAAQPFETWEVTNVSNLNSVVRLVKRDLADTVREDWTYSCAWESGEWVWDVADNTSHEYVPDDPTEFYENGTKWVCGVDGRLERITVAGTNGEEIVIRTLSYDDDGQLVLVDDGTNGCVTIAYDDAGNISEMTGPEGTLRAAWDADGVMTNLDTSAWNGDIPENAQPQRAPRRMLLGAPNGNGYEGMSFWDAVFHYIYGEGAAKWMPFSEIDTSWLTPKHFECVRSFISCCHEPGGYPISGTRVIPNDGPKQFYLGDVTIRLDGTITYTGNCNWTFDGTMRALPDTFNFDKARRGIVGEGLTAIGRLLFDSHGTPFQIDFIGTKPLTGSGHCGE